MIDRRLQSLRAALLVSALSLCTSCRVIATTQLVVVVDTNLTSADGITNIRVEVHTPEGVVQRESVFELAPTGPVALPLSFGVVPQGADARRRVRIIAQARTASGAVIVQRSALSGFFPDTALRLPLYLPNVCRGLVCPSGTTCRGDAPVCVSDEVSTDQLVPIGARPDGGEFDGGYSLPFRDGSAASPSPDASLDATAAIDAMADAPRPADAVADGSAYATVPTACAYAPGANGMRVTVPANAPRLVAPLSLSRVTSLRPTLRWNRPATADSARIELCEDRSCARSITQFDNAGDNARVATALPAGRLVFWRVTPLTAGAPSGPPSPVWYFRTPRADLGTDTSFQAQTDLNGDGFADVAHVVVTSSGLRINLAGSIFHGGPTGVCFVPQTRWSFTGSMGGTTESTAAGDINGDGYGDLIYTAVTSATGSGQLFVRFGSPAGVDTLTGQTIASPAGTTGFGTLVRIVGDLNRDGFADVAVHITGVTTAATRGGVVVYYGSATGLPATPSLTLDGGTAGELLGTDIAGGGADFDGDGFHDLAAARRGTMGGISVYRGSATGLVVTPELRASPVPARAAAVTSLSAADLNADGHSDAVYLTGIVGGGINTPSLAAAFVGGPAGLAASAGWTLQSASATAFMGGVRAGDSTGDDAADVLIIERSGTSPNFVQTPRVYSGAAGALTLTPNATAIDISGSRTLAHFVSYGGDTNGDGAGDFAVTSSFVTLYGYSGFGLLLGGASGWMAGSATFVPVTATTRGSAASGEVFD